jgi:hypothetical protein
MGPSPPGAVAGHTRQRSPTPARLDQGGLNGTDQGSEQGSRQGQQGAEEARREPASRGSEPVQAEEEEIGVEFDASPEEGQRKGSATGLTLLDSVKIGMMLRAEPHNMASITIAS